MVIFVANSIPMKLLSVIMLLCLSVSAHAQTDVTWINSNHTGYISAVSVSSDGNVFATSSPFDSLVLLWDGERATYRERVSIPGVSRVTTSAFKPGARVLAIGTDSTVYLYDVPTKSVIDRIELPPLNIPLHFRFNEDGSELLVLSYGEDPDRYADALIIDITTKTVIDSARLDGMWANITGWDPEYVSRLVSKDLRTVVISPSGSTITDIYDLRRDTAYRWYAQVTMTARVLGDDGSYIIFDNGVSDVQDSLYLPTMLLTPGVRQGRMGAGSISARSPVRDLTLFAKSRYGITPEWGVNHGYIYAVRGDDTTHVSGVVAPFAISPGDTILAGGSLGLTQYGAFNGQVLSVSPVDWGYYGTSTPHFSPRGVLSIIYLSNPFISQFSELVFGDSVIRRYDGSSDGNPCGNIPKIDPLGEYGAIGISVFSLAAPDFSDIAICPGATSEWHPTGSHYIWSEYNDTLVIQDRNGSRSLYPTGHRRINEIAVSRDGKYIATAGADSTVRIWDISGQLLNTLIGHTGEVLSVAFSPNSRQLMSASLDGTLRAWRVDMSQEIYRYDEFRETPRQVRIANDGVTVVALHDRAIVGYDARDWSNVRPSKPSASHSITASRTSTGIRIENELPIVSNARVEVYDVLGRLIFEKRLENSEQIELPIKDPQTLFIRLTSGSAIATAVLP
jgi:WD40 repeat protein